MKLYFILKMLNLPKRITVIILMLILQTLTLYADPNIYYSNITTNNYKSNEINFTFSWENDKFAHFFFSGSIVSVLYFSLSKFNFFETLYIPLVSSCITISIGILKEIYDNFQKDNFFDPYDLIADIMGTIVFQSLWIVIEYVSNKKLNFSKDFKNFNIFISRKQILIKFYI